jgi:uncharacterized membrane protein YbhN (UPF0104 family)
MSKLKFLGPARAIALLVLAAVTAVGVWTFVTGDWSAVISYWREHWVLIPALALLSIVDVVLEAIAWAWLYSRFGVKAFDRSSVLVYLAGRAGLLLPAQLGRLIRPDAMVRMGKGSFMQCLKAETLLFVLDGVSVLSLLAALLAYKVAHWAALPAGLASIAVMLFVGDKLAELLAHTHLSIERGFWWTGSTIAVVLISMAGWIAHGLGLYVVVADLPGSVTLWDALAFGPGSAVLGTGTGLPGGIGVTEGLLGASLRLRGVPVEHLAIVVAAFRLITFWIWIPIGWLALIVTRRQGREIDAEQVWKTP